jgi:hypothetical protein
MKFLLSTLFCIVALNLSAQGDITDQVVAAFKKSDDEAIGAFFMTQVELTTPKREGFMDKARAQQALAEFFQENPVMSFTVKHQGMSKLDDQFRIAELTTAKGVYRVTFFMKKHDGALQIKQLKIERD